MDSVEASLKATAVVAGAVLAMWCFMAVLADTLTALKGPSAA
ncbi:hypothetical protein [Paractinoplanes hotanensis]|nr:hypothetical protein [Actinoplanes hotanensis]